MHGKRLAWSFVVLFVVCHCIPLRSQQGGLSAKTIGHAFIILYGLLTPPPATATSQPSNRDAEVDAPTWFCLTYGMPSA